MYTNQTSKIFFLKLATNGQSDKAFCWHQNFVYKGLSAPAPGLYIHVEKHEKMCIKSEFKEIYLQPMVEVVRAFRWHQNFDPKICLPLPRGYIHV